jgi:hypothetical protein
MRELHQTTIELHSLVKPGQTYPEAVQWIGGVFLVAPMARAMVSSVLPAVHSFRTLSYGNSRRFSFFVAGFVVFFRVALFTALRAFFGASFFVTILTVLFPDTFLPLGTVRLGSGSSFPSTAGTTVVSDGVFMFLRVVIEVWNYWKGESVCDLRNRGLGENFRPELIRHHRGARL